MKEQDTPIKKSKSTKEKVEKVAKETKKESLKKELKKDVVLEEKIELKDEIKEVGEVKAEIVKPVLKDEVILAEKKEDVFEENMEDEIDLKDVPKKKYFETVGRRKTATARVRLFTQGKKGIEVNQKNFMDYFTSETEQKIVFSPLEKLKCPQKFGFVVFVKGGGKSAQAEAIRHGISRAFVLLNPLFKKRLKKFNYLTRDSRMVERKKPGLNKARRAPQWSKR